MGNFQSIMIWLDKYFMQEFHKELFYYIFVVNKYNKSLGMVKWANKNLILKMRYFHV